MISLSPIALFSFNLGPSVTAIGKLGWGQGKVTKDQVKELIVPWQNLLPDQKLFSLLSWHTRISEFAGRNKEMDQLNQWATSEHPVWVKFVIGEGGVGKSRLGAEFAETMQKEDWAAGFVDLRKAQAFPMKKAGTLLIIDYPEEHVNRVKELLKDLTNIGLDGRLRVLFLTRQQPDSWDEVVSAANARNIVDMNPITLSRLDPRSATTIFNTTVSEAGEWQKRSKAELGRALIREGSMTEWLKLAPENERALFIMAAAVHSAENPDREAVEFSGREIVKGMVEREVGRYQRMAEERPHMFKDKFALARLLAMAAIADELSVADIKNISESELPVGFQPDADIQGELMPTSLLIDSKVRASKPDIVAAAFMVDVLGRRPEHSPEIVWAALKDDIGGGLERIGRLCHDAEIVLGIHEPCLSDWLAEAVEGNFDRCSILEEQVSEVNLPLGWLKTAIAIWKTLLDHAGDDEERARFLNNLSTHLSATGDTAGALAAIQEAVELYHRLGKANPARFEPDLASSLNNLSADLSDTGDTAGALAAIQEAVEIYRCLAKANPARFESNLALSLNNLSNRLSDIEDKAGSLAAIQEAVEIYRHLAEANPARFEPDLALSLNNLSNRLSATGDTAGALEAIQKAVEIYRRLAEANPSWFEPDLATSLRNLGLSLLDMEKKSEAIDNFKEAIALSRPYAKQWPGSRHEKLLKDLEQDLKRASDDLQQP
jgi:tetratricopeptide (TPR) repeat protein